MAFNTGWLDIALKIERFINYKGHLLVTNVPKRTEEGLLYSDTIKRYKWSSRDIQEATIQAIRGIIHIEGGNNSIQNDLLERSMVGSLLEDIFDIPTLSEIRRWASSSWKRVHGTNIYEMGRNRFLFEFHSKEIMRGVWFRKKHKPNLQWWSPVVGSVPRKEKVNHVWIRLVGLPLQLWSQKVFKEVGDYWGGWIQTEEETKLRNHLKWARLKVKGDGDAVSKVVKVEFEGIHGNSDLVRSSSKNQYGSCCRRTDQ